MSINFFIAKCQNSLSDKEFGICDDSTRPWAYTDIIDKSKWIGIVKNPLEKQTRFIAIDKCLEIKKADGVSLESTCDGMLEHNDVVIFVELKERESKASIWAPKGIEQLKNTIKIFEANHNTTIYSKKLAYLVNSLRPNFASTQAVRMQKFKDDTGYLLSIQQEINI